MTDINRTQRLGSALQSLAADVVAERQRARVLRRENRQLRSELELLKRWSSHLGQPFAPGFSADAGEQQASCPLCGAPRPAELAGSCQAS